LLSFGVVGAFIVIGELNSDDMMWLREALPRKRSACAPMDADIREP
jgi:hypothetical protein